MIDIMDWVLIGIGTITTIWNFYWHIEVKEVFSKFMFFISSLSCASFILVFLILRGVL